jgi:hypothetical protein
MAILLLSGVIITKFYSVAFWRNNYKVLICKLSLCLWEELESFDNMQNFSLCRENLRSMMVLHPPPPPASMTGAAAVYDN